MNTDKSKLGLTLYVQPIPPGIPGHKVAMKLLELNLGCAHTPLQFFVHEGAIHGAIQIDDLKALIAAAPPGTFDNKDTSLQAKAENRMPAFGQN